MNTLKTTLVIALVMCSFSCVNAQWKSKKIKGNGNVTTIKRSTSDYDAVKCAGWMDFVLVNGDEGDITIEGEENLLDYIITEVDGNTLKIKTKNGINLKPSYNKSVKITIPFQDINEVSLSGSGDVMNLDRIEASNFKTKMSGSGDIVLNIKANYSEAYVTGSGDLTLKGQTDNLKASVTGSGDFHGFNLESNDVEAKVTGSGNIETVCNGELKARVTGSGDIEYKGNPKREDTKVTGSGSIGK
ncbi:head GIN domain-containing protein [uncultured Lacinutrix sp.]|uniref:head GIN domain-containing protein n=1 Tax=uncultured Lacinutrix sp. TaxID=574032 RepID=UPI002636C501|nr:head GIN domain-containing protein [uncultured Lacinutrix sp.]